MAWTGSTRVGYYRQLRSRKQIRPSFGINNYCFIRREHECGKLFNASKSCFVACPTNEELDPILELISEKLTKVGIEPIIAIKERSYGQDIFCTKICGKIIESRFCLVILDDTEREEGNFPNPNVYYEYGLMTSMNKHIIPLQRQDLELAFNIQSHDTIKYTPKNISKELDRAIRDAIKITDTKEMENKIKNPPDKLIHRKFELSGFELKNSSWILSDLIEDTNFIGYGSEHLSLYVYMGKIDEKEEQASYLEDMELLVYRTEKEYEAISKRIEVLDKSLKTYRKVVKEKKVSPIRSLGMSSYDVKRQEEELETRKTLLGNMNNIFIGFIMNIDEGKDNFIKKAYEIVKSNPRFKLAFSDENKIVIEGIEIPLEQEELV